MTEDNPGHRQSGQSTGIPATKKPELDQSSK